MLGLSPPGVVSEAAVAAARLGAAEGQWISFLPLTPGYERPKATELAAWYGRVAEGARRGLRLLEESAAWAAEAKDQVAQMKGRTPVRLVRALVATPALSVEMAAEITQTSRAAAARNLDRFEALGLVREITAQRRFRFWRARL